MAPRDTDASPEELQLRRSMTEGRTTTYSGMQRAGSGLGLVRSFSSVASKGAKGVTKALGSGVTKIGG